MNQNTKKLFVAVTAATLIASTSAMAGKGKKGAKKDGATQTEEGKKANGCPSGCPDKKDANSCPDKKDANGCPDKGAKKAE